MKKVHKNKNMDNKLRFCFGFVSGSFLFILLSCSKPTYSFLRTFHEFYFMLGQWETTLKTKHWQSKWQSTEKYICEHSQTQGNPHACRCSWGRGKMSGWILKRQNASNTFLKTRQSNCVCENLLTSLLIYTSAQGWISTYLVSLWPFIAARNSLTVSGLWYLHGVFEMYFSVCKE